MAPPPNPNTMRIPPPGKRNTLKIKPITQMPQAINTKTSDLFFIAIMQTQAMSTTKKEMLETMFKSNGMCITNIVPAIINPVIPINKNIFENRKSLFEFL